MAKYLHKSPEVSKTMSNSFVKEDAHFVHVLQYMWNITVVQLLTYGSVDPEVDTLV